MVAGVRPVVSGHIIRNPRILAGEPIIEGTRIPVRAVVLTHRLYGDVHRVCQALPILSPQAVEEALAYYENHRDEIDASIREEEANYEESELDSAS